MGYLIALTTVLCWSLGIFPFTEAARRFGTGALNQYRLLLAWLLITLITCMYYGISPISLAKTPTAHNYLYLGLSGIIGFTIGDFCAFNSFKMLGPKLGSLYTTIAPCAALVFGALILDEKINAVGVMGMLITISGVIWLTLSKKVSIEAAAKGFTRNRVGIVYGIIGALCQGSGLVLSKVGLHAEAGETAIPTLHAVWVRLLFAFVAAMLVAVFSNNFISNAKTILTNKNKGFLYMIAGTMLGPVMGVSLSLLAITYLHVAEAQTIFALLPVFVLPLNFFFYRERITISSLLACLTAVCGVFVLIWRELINQWIFPLH